MKKTTLLSAIVIFLAIYNIAAAQKKAINQISGKVETENHQPGAFATVALVNAKDSAIVKNELTNDSGNYSFSHVAEGKYFVRASAVGKSNISGETVQISAINDPFFYQTLVLKNEQKSLKEVTVTAAKPFLEQKVDKLVVNVEGSAISTGNNVMELLQKVPGITVDENDNISLNGKSGITIMINGKLTYLSQQQLATMLKSMNASELSQIEIITNPSAKYDAAGTSGIINIKLKKNSGEGIQGSVNASYAQGVHAQTSDGINLNYKKGKVNLYGSYNIFNGKNGSTFNLDRKYLDAQTQEPNIIIKQNSPRLGQNTYQSVRTGIDYSLDSKNTIGAMFNSSFSNSMDKNFGPLSFYDGNGQLDSTVVPQTNSKEHWNSTGYNVNYKSELDTMGQELSADLDYSTFTSTNHQNFETAYMDAQNNPLHNTKYRRGDLPSNINIKSAKIDYTLPLDKSAKIETGFKSSIVTSDNNVSYQNRLDNQWQNDLGATNHFIYKENINAAYINYSRDFKAISIQIGLRGEQTISNADQITIDSVVKRNYFQLFPSLFVKRDWGKNNSVSFSYSRRIDRPDYQNLNPFIYYIDDYTYSQGNPFLQPELTNSFEIANRFKQTIISLSYEHTNNVIRGIIKQNDTTHANFETKENLSTYDYIGLSVSMPINFTHWWTSNNYGNVYYNNYKGQVNGGQLNAGIAAYGFNSSNTFTLPWGLKAELSGYYNSKSVDGQWIRHAQYSVSTGIQKSFWQKAANIKLNINDVFNTQQYHGSFNYQNLDLQLHNTWESRRIGLSFTYNFGNKNLKSTNHKSSIEDEQNRIGN